MAGSFASVLWLNLWGLNILGQGGDESFYDQVRQVRSIISLSFVCTSVFIFGLQIHLNYIKINIEYQDIVFLHEMKNMN